MSATKPSTMAIAACAVTTLAAAAGLSALFDTTKPAVAQDTGLPPGSVVPWKPDGRPYHMAVTPLGTQYKLYDTCSVEHDNMRSVRVPMALYELQRFVQCEGKELSATSVTGIRQKVLQFDGKDPQDSFIAVVQNRRVMHIQRGI